MKFTVKFRSIGSIYAIAFSGKNVGYKALLQARKVTGVKDLTPDLVNGGINSMHVDPKINVPEKGYPQIFQTGFFDEDHNRSVIVPSQSLTKYVQFTPEWEIDDETGAVRSFRFIPWYDEDEILNDWLLAGCPENWNLESVNSENNAENE